MKISLTRDFKETIRERARSAAAFREARLKEILLSGDVDAGKTGLGDCINPTMGFDVPGCVGIPKHSRH